MAVEFAHRLAVSIVLARPSYAATAKGVVGGDHTAETNVFQGPIKVSQVARFLCIDEDEVKGSLKV